jgi:hypothetical protein
MRHRPHRPRYSLLQKDTPIPLPRRSTLLKTLTLLSLALTTIPGAPYSVQTHEELIDLAWKQSIRPLLLSRYPNLTDAQLQEAHAYAYGGCAIQDFGYYPAGHMVYLNVDALKELKGDMVKFYGEAQQR